MLCNIGYASLVSFGMITTDFACANVGATWEGMYIDFFYMEQWELGRSCRIKAPRGCVVVLWTI